MSQGIAIIVAGIVVAASILTDGYLERRAKVDLIERCIDITMASKGFHLEPGAGGEERDEFWIECAQSVR